MSLSSRRTFLMLPLVLAACGFTPVYAPGGAGQQLQGNVTVSEPRSRSAFLLTRQLEERLGRSVDPSYLLDLQVSISIESLGFDSAGSITRYNWIGTASYTLTEASSGRVITSGNVDNFAGYSATGTNVATLAAQRDAQERLMTLLADQIVTRVLVADLS